MNIIDRAREAFAMVEREKSAYVGFPYTPVSQGWYTAQNPLLQAIGEYNGIENPRLKLGSYRALAQAVTIIRQAMRTHRTFIGIPKIAAGEQGDPRAVKALEKFWDTTPIHGQHINEIAADRGLSQFVARMVDGTLRDGSQFYQIVQEPTEGNRVNKAPIQALRIFDSANFNYTQRVDNTEQYELQYTSPMTMLRQIRSLGEGFREFHFSASSEWLWGLPLCHGAEMASVNFLKYLLAVVANAENIGNPLSITAIGFEPPVRGVEATEVYTARVKELTDQVGTVKNTVKEALSARSERTKPINTLITLPSSSIKIDQKSLGEGLQALTNVPQILESFMLQIGNALDTPLTFLGISTGGGGIGSDKYRFEKEAMKMKAEAERKRFVENVLRQIHEAVLVSQSIQVRPDSYKIEWETPDLDDEKLEADTRLIEAQATAQELLNVAAIQMEFSGQGNLEEVKANYLNEIDRPTWVP
jgi:hypothetical protein